MLATIVDGTQVTTPKLRFCLSLRAIPSERDGHGDCYGARCDGGEQRRLSGGNRIFLVRVRQQSVELRSRPIVWNANGAAERVSQFHLMLPIPHGAGERVRESD